MRAYIIYIKGNTQSEKIANLGLSTSLDCGYKAELFEGITPATLKTHVDKYKLSVIQPGHMYDRSIGINGSKLVFESKYSNFLNHYTLWHRSIELNEPIVILEHDVIAVSAWQDYLFDELLVLNMRSGLYQEQFKKDKKPDLYAGIHTYSNPFFTYKSQNIWQHGSMIPGTAAYAITPKGANRLIHNVKQYGYEKADYIINTKTVHMQYIQPDVFILSHHIMPNLRTSHGE